MTFDNRESSRSKGRPVTLYLFEYGEGDEDYYGYTDSARNITADDHLYKAVPVDRQAITSSGSLDRATLDVRLPKDTDIARLFATWPPSTVVTLKIMQGHLGEAQMLVAWAGRVLGRKVEGDEAAFTCEPVHTSMKRTGLRRGYQYGCPHVLYGPQCKADQEAATQPCIVLGVSGAFITLPAGWDTAARRPKYVGGMVHWTLEDGRLERRSILRVQDDNLIILSGNAQGLKVGDTVNMVLGCNHKAGLEDDCIVLHNNIHNYGGQPWIPLKSPIGYINIYW